MVSYHAISDAGCVRPENEDRVLADIELNLFVVADGMGGHRHGGLAAELTISTLRYFLLSSENRSDVTWPFGYNFELSLGENRLATGIQLANRQVWKQAELAPEYAGMGSTIAAALLNDSSAAVASVGDSRVYLLRRGELRQLTTDDTWLNAVIQKGALDETALMNHPMRNVLTQAAGSQHNIEVHTVDLPLEDCDLLLLSSDGLHDIIGASQLQAILLSSESPEKIASRLIEAGRTEGAPDNLSCLALRYSR